MNSPTTRFNWAKRWLSNQLTKPKHRQKPTSLTQAESLEDRTLLSTFVVSNSGYSQTTGLTFQEAVTAASRNPGPDKVVFSDEVLQQGLRGIDHEVLIDTEITIDGLTPSGAVMTIRPYGSTQTRLFIVTSTGKLTLENINLTDAWNSDGNGGAIHNSGVVVLKNTDITDSVAKRGAAVYNAGELVIQSSSIYANRALFAGGIYQSGLNAKTRILNSTLTDNYASHEGGAILNYLGDMAIVSSTIVGNRANNEGGGIYGFSDANSVTSINNSIVAGNELHPSQAPNDVVFTTDGLNSTGTFDISNSWANIIGDASTSGGLSDADRMNIVGVEGVGVRPLEEIVDSDFQSASILAVVVGSVAIDAGLTSRTKDPGADHIFFTADDGPMFEFDQRGLGFDRVIDSGSAKVDIGAFEFEMPDELIVSNSADEVDGNISPGALSLREALNIANSRPGHDTITLMNVHIRLSLEFGELPILDEVTIVGQSFEETTISPSGYESFNTGTFVFIPYPMRVFNISTSGQVELDSISLYGANPSDGNPGAAILHQNAQLLIRNSVLNGFNDTHREGGEDEIATNGGAIGSILGTDANASLTIITSTVSGQTEFSGGAIYTEVPTHIINSTISGARADRNGAAIFVNNGTTTITNSTIAVNRSNTRPEEAFEGGGIYTADNPSAQVVLHNTIVIGNVSGWHSSLEASDILGKPVMGTHNLIGDADNAGGLPDGVDGNIVGMNGVGVRPIETVIDETLRDFGGNGLYVHALVQDSPAINAGDGQKATDENGNPLTNDGRGAPYERFGRGGDDGLALVDIGAYEVQPLFVVNINQDRGWRNDNDLTFRRAVDLANAQMIGANIGGIPDEIRFEGDLPPNLVLQSPVTIESTGGLRISGGDGQLLTISAYQNQIFNITSGGTVELSNLKLETGSQSAEGGAIYNEAHLKLNRVWLEKNKAEFGGAIFNGPGPDTSLTITNSTISGSVATVGSGGAIYSLSPLTIINSTISGSIAEGQGGAIYQAAGTSPVKIVNSTIVNNISRTFGRPNGGGGLYLVGGVVTLQNSLIASNIGDRSAPDKDIELAGGSITADSQYNLIGNAGPNDGLTHGVNNNIVGRNGVGTIPGSQIFDTELKDNGGLIPTHALAPSSLALNSGSNALAKDAEGNPLPFDNRGSGFQRIVGSAVDRGAYEEVNATNFLDVFGYNTTTGQVYLGKNTNGTIDQQVAQRWDPALGWDIHSGDFTGDGVMDIAGRTDAGYWYVIDGTTGVHTYWGRWGSDAASRWNDASVQGIVEVGDFNGDGLDDVMGKNWRGEFYVSLSTGTGFSGTIYWGRVAQLGWTNHEVGDFNGDGLTDVVSFRDNGDRWVNVNSGTAFALDYYGRVGTQASAQWRNFMVGDWNGDGFDDIIQQDSVGQWWIGYSNGQADGVFTIQYANRWDPNAFEEFQVGDFNGDGREEFVGRSTTNQLWVNRSLPNGRMNPEFFNGWAASATFSMTVGDFNGDGMTDVAGVRQSDGAWFLQQSTGTGTRAIGSLFGNWNNFTGQNKIGSGDIFV